MCFSRTYVAVLLPLVFSIPVQAQQPAAAVQRDPQALSLLAQCSAAMGAKGTAPDIYAEGTITPANPDRPSSAVVLKSKGMDRSRSEVNLPSNQQVFVVNNGRGYSLTSGQKKHLAAQATYYFRPEHLAAFACGIDVARPSMGISYVGPETVGTVSTHHLFFRSASSDPLEQLISEFHVYLDASTFRVVKTATWVFAPDAIENRSRWETYYDNYQSVAGVLVPMHISHFLAGTHFDDWSLTSVRTDVAISENDFN